MKKAALILCTAVAFGSSLFAQTDKMVVAFTKSIEQEKKQDYAFAIGTMLDLNDSTSYEINVRLGWLYYKAGLKKKSLYYYNKAITIKPNAIEPRYGFGFPAYMLEDYSQLISQDKKILELDPYNKIINSNLGSIYYYSKEYKNALPYFEKVASLYPFDYDNNLMLGWTYLKLGKLKEAEESFNTVLLYSPKDLSANDGLNYTKKAFPLNPQVLAGFTKSYELSDKNDYKGSIEVMKSIYDSQSYYINLRLGWLTYLAGLQSESINYYKTALQLKPNAIEPKFGYAYPTEVLGNKNEVKSQYESILSIDPHNTSAHYKLGVLEYTKKEYQLAYTHFDKIVNLYPCDTDGLLMLAWTNYYLGKTTESKVLFNKVLCLSPNNESALQGLGLRALDQIKKTTGF